MHYKKDEAKDIKWIMILSSQKVFVFCLSGLKCNKDNIVCLRVHIPTLKGEMPVHNLQKPLPPVSPTNSQTWLGYQDVNTWLVVANIIVLTNAVSALNNMNKYQ